MTDLDQKQLLSALQAKQAEVAASLGRREGLAVQAEADAFDEIQHALDRALLVRNLDCGSELLREVRNAVTRIEKGEYGPCQECGEEINPKRLAAVPWAALCLRCQEEADANSAIWRREPSPLVETLPDSYPQFDFRMRHARGHASADSRRHVSHVSFE